MQGTAVVDNAAGCESVPHRLHTRITKGGVGLNHPPTHPSITTIRLHRLAKAKGIMCGHDTVYVRKRLCGRDEHMNTHRDTQRPTKAAPAPNQPSTTHSTRHPSHPEHPGSHLETYRGLNCGLTMCDGAAWAAFVFTRLLFIVLWRLSVCFTHGSENGPLLEIVTTPVLAWAPGVFQLSVTTR